MDKMEITFINVGYGEAIYLQCPDDTHPQGVFTMLIDGGSGEAAEYENTTTGRLSAAAYLHLAGSPFLDIMVNTHIHEDHLCGLLPVAQLLPPREFWQSFDANLTLPTLDTPEEGTDNSMRKFLAALRDYSKLRTLFAKTGCVTRQLQAGEQVSLCKGLTAQILGPNADQAAALAARLAQLGQVQEDSALQSGLRQLDSLLNNYSMMLRLDYYGVKILLPGDTNAAGYGALAEQEIQADIFKVGHHGQEDGVSEALLRRIAPSHVVCCASSDRRYGSAAPAILDMVADYGAALHFSDCPLATVPTHEALVLSVKTDGSIKAAYRSLGHSAMEENRAMGEV